jgi:EmrB/QacA subfamily drug resistance transporter
MTAVLEPAKSRWVLALASIGAFMVALDALVVTTALSAIKVELDASMAQLEWTVNAFILSFAALLMTGAVLGDRFGRRRIFVTGLGVFTAASAGCALAPDIGWLIAARAVQGIGAALVTPVALALVSAAFAPERRGRALGTYSAAIALAGVCAPVVGGGITEGIAYQWIFWLNIPIGVVTSVLVLSRVEESFGPRARPDLVGATLVTAAGLGFVWGLLTATSKGWDHLEVAASLAGAVLLAAAFIHWESHAGQPMLPTRLFRSRAFSAGNAVSFLLFGSTMSLTFFLAQFHQSGLGTGPFEAGLRLLPWTVAFFVCAQRAGVLVDRLGERSLIVIGMLLQAGGIGALAVIASPELDYAMTIAPMMITGIGAALALPACQKAVVGPVAAVDIGRASGTFTTMRWLGGLVGVAAAAAAFAATGGYGSPQEFSDGFAAASVVSAGLALLGAAAGAVLPTGHEPGLLVQAGLVARPGGVGSRRRFAKWSAQVPLELEGVDAVNPVVWGVRQLMAGNGAQPREARRDLLERDARFKPSRRRADAEMDALPERDVIADIGPVGAREPALVPGCRSEEDQHPRAGGVDYRHDDAARVSC